MQANELSMANLIWQQRAPEAAKMMASLIDACATQGTEQALKATEILQSEFVARVFRHPLTVKFMQASPALLRCVRLLLEACDSLGADVDDDLANFMAEASCAPSQSWLCVRAAHCSCFELLALTHRQVQAVSRIFSVGLGVVE
jgi:hypothetical protein